MKICLFDIDGTLITTGGSGGRAMQTAVAEEFDVEKPELDIPFAGRSDRSIVGDVFKAAGVEFSEPNWSRFVERYLSHLQRELDECNGNVYDGVVPVLELVHAAEGIEVGLLTGNLELAAWAKVSHFGINEFFSFGGFGDREPHRDDVAREAATTVAAKFGEPDEIIVIGDTPADVQCGRAIGATTIAVATGSFPFKELVGCSPDHAFHSMADAHNYFAELGIG